LCYANPGDCYARRLVVCPRSSRRLLHHVYASTAVPQTIGSVRLQLVPVTCYTNVYTIDLFSVSRQIDTIPVTSPAIWTPRLLPRQLGTASACAGDHNDLVNSQAQFLFTINIFTTSICFISVSVTFADLLYMLFPVLFPSPSTRSGAWRSRHRHARGLEFSNLRVVRPEGLN
jgi:hypothetical protein